jgi:hypothetical protein
MKETLAGGVDFKLSGTLVGLPAECWSVSSRICNKGQIPKKELPLCRS